MTAGRRRALLLLGSLTALTLLFGPIAPATGHGILESATPSPDARVGSVPATVKVTLTEEPMPGGRLRVTDGCGEQVVSNVQVRDDSITGDVGKAEPGRWKVAFDFISAVDGHRYSDDYSFTVTGPKNCSSEASSPPGGGDDNESAGDEGHEAEEGADEAEAAGAGSADPSSSSGSDGGLPLVGIAVGTVAVLALALFARSRAQPR